MVWSKSLLVLALASVFVFVGCSANPSSPDVEMTAPVSPNASLSVGQGASIRGGEGGRGDGPVIYVTSQGLYYDSIVTAEPVPNKGPFQKLYMGPNGLTTMYGPRNPGYRGGRWWLDLNGNGQMDEEDPDNGDHYFVCPLLGPGRDTP